MFWQLFISKSFTVEGSWNCRNIYKLSLNLASVNVPSAHNCGWSLMVVFSMRLQAWSRTAHTFHIFTRSHVSLFEHLCVSQCVVACILTMFACLWCACRQMVGQMSGLPREAPCGFFPGQLNVCPVSSDTILEHLTTMQLIRPPWTKPSYRSVQEWCGWHVTACIVAWTYALYVAKPACTARSDAGHSIRPRTYSCCPHRCTYVHSPVPLNHCFEQFWIKAQVVREALA